MQRKYYRQKPMIVIIVVPLNSKLEDQVQCLQGSTSACFLSIDGDKVSAYDINEEIEGCMKKYTNLV